MVRSYAPFSSQISIHALREEGDRLSYNSLEYCLLFLSTPSARRATRRTSGGCSSRKYFYPRPPRGGRQGPTLNRTRFEIFLSTPSARRATRQVDEARRIAEISIHALREEGDLS